MKGRETLTQDERDVRAVQVLVAAVERGWAVRQALRAAWIEHACEEGRDCCGAAFCGIEGAQECAHSRRIDSALADVDAGEVQS